MQVLADNPLLDVLCRSLSAEPASVEFYEWKEPLLVYAHTRAALPGVARPFGGLAYLERMLAAAPPSAICRFRIIGFLSFANYLALPNPYHYLVTWDNYVQLPHDTALLKDSDEYPACEKKHRNDARKKYTDLDWGRITHALSHYSNPKTKKEFERLKNTLRDIAEQVVSEETKAILTAFAKTSWPGAKRLPGIIQQLRERLRMARRLYGRSQVG
jgi:hypothetical protein